MTQTKAQLIERLSEVKAVLLAEKEETAKLRTLVATYKKQDVEKVAQKKKEEALHGHIRDLQAMCSNLIQVNRQLDKGILKPYLTRTSPASLRYLAR
jgi:hypothetical protein